MTTGPGNPTTGSVPPTTTTTTQPADSGSDGDSGGNPFIPYPDGGDGESCSTVVQDCPDGEKCTVWANDGGTSWNATRCVPVVDDPDGIGEPCLVEGSPFSGLDTCELGAMCFWVDGDTLEGTCIPFCSGTKDVPICDDEGYFCRVTGSGIPLVCVPRCDPLGNDCAPGQACIPYHEDFECTPVPEDAAAPGEACEFVNGCVPGAMCAAPELVPGCDSAGCCTMFCDLNDPAPPCLPGQTCVAWYAEGQVPGGDPSPLGVCIVE